MKKTILLSTVLALALSLFWGCSGPKDDAQYLGLTPPELTPVPFMPELVNTPDKNERDITFMPNLAELYFSRQGTPMVSKYVDSSWTTPTVASYASPYQDMEPFITPDGTRLYFISTRKLDRTEGQEPWQVWFVDRVGDDWGIPKRLSDQGEFYPTQSIDGELFMTSAKNDLLRATVDGDSVVAREYLGDSVNSKAAEYNSAISPNGKMLVFTTTGRGPGFGGGDLWACFRKPDRSWGAPRNLGPGINTDMFEYCPAFSPDGKYFFFASNREGTEDIYWVNASRLQESKDRDLNLGAQLFQTVIDDGIEAALKSYDLMETEYAHYCDFDGGLLNGVGNRLLREERADDARALFRVGAERYPDTQTWLKRLKLAVLDDDQAAISAVTTELKQRDDLGRPIELTINRLGYSFIQWKRIDNAVDVMKLNVGLFPESANVFDSYGEMLALQGDTTAAIANYEQSLKLNPDSQNAVDMLKKLRGK